MIRAYQIQSRILRRALLWGALIAWCALYPLIVAQAAIEGAIDRAREEIDSLRNDWQSILRGVRANWK